MTVKTISILVLSIMVIATSSFTSSYAGHGGGGSSGGGGGCSGDCVPPTLGLDQQGKIRVEGGLTINSESFDVETYSQTIQTQIFKIGQKNTISLKMYENTSPEFLSHVELHFGVYEKVVEGITVEESITSIVWDDTGGDEVYGVYGDEEMFKSVKIEHEINGELTVLTFEMEAVKVLEESTLMTNIWDEKRNVSKNYFYNAVQIIDEKQAIENEVSVESIQPSIKESVEEIAIPVWIKSTAGWWAEDKIDNLDFILGIQYLTDNQILTIPHTEKTEIGTTDKEIPAWIKSTAGWWAKDLIQDNEFVNGMQFLINQKIILV